MREGQKNSDSVAGSAALCRTARWAGQACSAGCLMDAHKEQAKSIFLNALEIPSHSGRCEYVAAQCAGDEALRREVEGLLEHHAGMGSFLEAAAPPPSARGVGSVIGPYKLIEQLGE